MDTTRSSLEPLCPGPAEKTGLSVLSGSPSRGVRSRVDDASGILEKYETDPGSVGFETAAQAAAVLLDLKNNVDIGYGTVDNKNTYRQAMEVGDRAGALNRFLTANLPGGKTSTVRAEGPVNAGPPTGRSGVRVPLEPPTAEAPERVGDLVRKIVGEKYTSMPHDQLVGLQERARQQQEQQQQQPDQQQ